MIFFPFLRRKLLSFAWCYWARKTASSFPTLSQSLVFSFYFPSTNSLIRALRRRIYRSRFVSHMSDLSAAHRCTCGSDSTIWSTFHDDDVTKYRFNGLYFLNDFGSHTHTRPAQETASASELPRLSSAHVVAISFSFIYFCTENWQNAMKMKQRDRETLVFSVEQILFLLSNFQSDYGRPLPLTFHCWILRFAFN